MEIISISWISTIHHEPICSGIMGMSRDMEKRRERGTNRFSTFCSSLFITSVYINLFALHHPCLVSLLVPRDIRLQI